MLFKDWIIYDHIKTDVFEVAVEQFLMEKALNDTILFIIESIESEAGADREIYRSGRWENRTANKWLKNAILKMRWRAIFDRRIQVEKLKSYVKEIQRLRSSGNFSDQTKIPSVLRQASVMLAKMDYIKYKDEDEEFSNEELSELEKVLIEASKESDNRLPPAIEAHLDPEKIEKLIANWRPPMSIQSGVPPELEDVIGDRAIAKAKEDFYTILTSVVKLHFEKAVGNRGVKTADVDDLANSFLMRMDEFFTKKRRLKGKKIPSWDFPKNFPAKNLGKETASLDSEDSPDDESISHLLSYIAKSATREMARQRRESSKSLSPKRPTRPKRGEGFKRTDRVVLINKDFRSGNFKVYEDYLKALSSGKEKSWEEDWRKSLADTEKKMSQDDELRLKIIKDIAFLASTRKAKLFLSKDPSKIKTTLYEYLDRILRRSDRDPLHMSTLAGDDSDDDGSGGVSDVLSSSIESDDEIGGSPDAGMAGSFSNPASIVRSGEETNIILNMLHQALVKLSEDDPMGAICLCIKFGLAFSPVWNPAAMDTGKRLVKGLKGVVVSSSRVTGMRPGTTINIPVGVPAEDGTPLPPFSSNKLRVTNRGTLYGGNDASDCVKQIATIGLSPEEVLDRIVKIPGFEGLQGKQTSINMYLTKATEKLCDIMRSLRLPGVLHRTFRPTMADEVLSGVKDPVNTTVSGPPPSLPKQGIVDRKFNPNRPSPLASRLRKP